MAFRAFLRKAARIKNSTALLLVFGLMFGLTALLVSILAGDVMRAQAMTEAESKARILIDQNLAIHAFYSKILKPNLFAFTEAFRPREYFDPSWMSSTYAVRQIRNRFGALNPAGYSIKDAAVNARSPENEADEVERAFLAQLRADPGLELRSYQATVDGVPCMVYLRRGEVLEESCMGCHSEPDLAPAELVGLYGGQRSFHREADVGKVISVISIRIPLSDTYAEVGRFSYRLTFVLLGLLAALFLAQHLISRNLLYRPLAAIRDKALAISGDEGRLGEVIATPFGRELGEMASAFNAMSLTLRRDRDQLEKRIEERTAELSRSNALLAEDIAERKRTEALLQKSLEENTSLLRELQHRAKNSFSMIDGLIELSSGPGASEETRAALGDLALRVRSVSGLYSLLYSSASVTEVRLDHYLDQVVSAMARLSSTVTFRSKLAALVVPAKGAVPLGLIVTELVTNALKYAFSGRRDGSITVLLSEGGGAAVLEVRDDGSGLREGADRQGEAGQGLGLVRALAEQIGGSFAITSEGAGTRCVLSFPLRSGGAY